jgi:hypothetical protein
LGITITSNKTVEYFHEAIDFKDLRPLINGKKDVTKIEAYTQVFEEKYGFLNNLSILDLLFNEGRYAVDYLKKQTL